MTKRAFVQPTELPAGHLGKRAREAPRQGPVPTRQPLLEAVDWTSDVMQLHERPDMFDGVENILRDGFLPPTEVAIITLEGQMMGWMDDTTHNKRSCRFYWYPEKEALYYHGGSAPPGWLLTQTWRRLMAVELGIIESIHEELPGEPGRPRDPEPRRTTTQAELDAMERKRASQCRACGRPYGTHMPKCVAYDQIRAAANAVRATGESPRALAEALGLPDYEVAREAKRQKVEQELLDRQGAVANVVVNVAAASGASAEEVARAINQALKG